MSPVRFLVTPLRRAYLSWNPLKFSNFRGFLYSCHPTSKTQIQPNSGNGSSYIRVTSRHLNWEYRANGTVIAVSWYRAERMRGTAYSGRMVPVPNVRYTRCQRVPCRRCYRAPWVSVIGWCYLRLLLWRSVSPELWAAIHNKGASLRQKNNQKCTES